MSSKKKSKSLAEKIGEAVTSVPKVFESDDEAEETRAKVVDYDSESEDDIEDFKNEFRKSNLRKQNVGLLEQSDKRYSAKKVSKDKLFNQYDSSEGDESEDDDEEAEDTNGADDSDEALTDDESEAGEEVCHDSGKEEGDGSDDDDDDDDEDGDDNGDSEHSDEEYASLLKGADNSSNEEEEEDEEDESDYDDLDESKDISNPLRRDRGPKKDAITTVSDTNIAAEVEKGNAVRSQLQLWENLLEMRIKLQKCLVDSNKMPQHDVYKNYSKNPDFKKDCKGVSNKLNGLLSSLLDLQSKLLSQYPETKGILSDGKRNKNGKIESTNEEDSMDEEIPSDFEDGSGNENESGLDGSEDNDAESDDEETNEPPKKMIKLDAFEQVIAKNHKTYREYRNSVVQKWNDKVRLATGAISKGPNQPALQQIEFALANKDKLRKKTQLKRSEYEIIGKSTSTLDENDGRRLQEYDEEIYDDDDFYHQLLKELIEFKSADIQDPLKLSQQWVQLQNMRSKMKRKIDTRATKGRRLRYDVHQKLVNFMAPITVNDTWTDHAKDELYSSLFGKIKPTSNASKAVER